MTWTLKSVVRFICLESCLFPLELVVCVFLCVCAIAWLLDVNSVLWFTQCYLEHLILVFSFLEMGFPCGSAGKESTCNEGSLGSIPGLGRFPGEGKGYPLQYSGLENSMVWIVHGVAWIRLKLAWKVSATIPTLQVYVLKEVSRLF